MTALYADQDVGLRLVQALRTAGHTVTMAREVGMARASDPEQLLFATQHHWPLLTRNRDDFILLHDAWLHWPRGWQLDPTPVHAGILIMVYGAPAPRMTQDVRELLRSNVPLANQLFLWTAPNVWTPRPQIILPRRHSR